MGEQRLTDRTVETVRAAAIHAHRKHGPLTTNHERAMAILIKETGEALHEVLTMTRNGATPTDKIHCRKRMYDELAQVASTAMLLMENLHREM